MAADRSAALRRRWKVNRILIVQPWRIVASVRAFRGNGRANFEFEFRLGFPRHSPSVQRAEREMLRVEV